MKLIDVIEYIEGCFENINETIFREESGISYDAKNDITTIGYSTNLTPEVVEIANDENIDLIITHYRAWEFIEGFNEKCMDLLKTYSISHYHNHLPLDDAPFGTNSSLAKVLNLKEFKKANEDDGFMCGLVAKTEIEYTFNDFVKHVESKLEESVQAWKFNEKPVKKVHILCGGGQRIRDIMEAKEEGCDTYITGEKNLYLIEFAQFHNINLIVGSHTFTEVFGVEGMAKKIENGFNEINIKRIKESHFEEHGMIRHR